MRISRSFMVVLLWTTCILTSFGQMEVKQLELDPVESSIKRLGEQIHSLEQHGLYRLPGNGYMYVRSIASPPMSPHLHKASAFLFNAEGKLVSSNKDLKTKGEMSKDGILKIVQFNGQVLLITVKNAKASYICKLWDITDPTAPVNKKTLEIPKSNALEDFPEVAVSPSSHFLAFASANGHELYVFDKDYESAYSKNIIPRTEKDSNLGNHIDAFSITDDGFVGMSILFQEQPGFWANAINASWFFLGIDIINDKVSAYDMNEIVQAKTFKRSNSMLVPSENGTFAYIYYSENFHFIKFNVAEEKVSAAHRHVPSKLFSNSETSETLSISVHHAFVDQSNQLVVSTRISGATQTKYNILTLNDRLEIVVNEPIDWFATNGSVANYNRASMTNTLLIPSYATSDKLVAQSDFTTSLGVPNTTEAIPNVVAYNSISKKFQCIPFKDNLNVKQKDKLFFVTHDGLAAGIEIDGFRASITLLDLKEK